MLQVSSRVSIPLSEIQLQAIRSQGAGGQNVNKVSTAVHLFFDIRASSLPEVYKERLLKMKDRRISPAGTVIIKSQEARTQEANREKALQRLKELLKEAMRVRKSRRATAPTRGSKERRLQAKVTRSKTKKLRRRPGPDD
ncbi:MAG: alternative ribosome rescue aminoacyl-tRNA hydrolase ArfB [Verrucomicrobiota bacterium]|nr:alternative ribosome rescue aminoacyl-tRNA hydrolase ArfB [Verrucomicrobiota bacterium]